MDIGKVSWIFQLMKVAPRVFRPFGQEALFEFNKENSLRKRSTHLFILFREPGIGESLAGMICGMDLQVAA